MRKSRTCFEIIATIIFMTGFGMCVVAPVMAVSESEDSSAITEAELPLMESCEMTFSSGAGAWKTMITLNSDGSFSGIYTDGEMGLMGDDYPNGTEYICEFTGRFQNITQLDETSYTMELSEDNLSLKYEEGTTWIEDGFRYVVSLPNGLEGEDGIFIFYTPEREIEGLDEEFLSWCNSLKYDEQPESKKTLGCYGLWNQEQGSVFFSEDEAVVTNLSESSLNTDVADN